MRSDGFEGTIGPVMEKRGERFWGNKRLGRCKPAVPVEEGCGWNELNMMKKLCGLVCDLSLNTRRDFMFVLC